VERRFPIDRPLGFFALLLPSETGWLSFHLRGVRDGHDGAEMSATGRSILGDVLDNTPRISVSN
jgi:hypothetical protein